MKIIVAMRGREGGQRLEPNQSDTTNTITTVTKDNLILEIRQIGNISPGTNRDNPNQGRVYDPDGLSPTLSGMQGGGRQPHILEARCIGGIGEKKSNGGTQYFQQDRVYTSDGLALCLPANLPGGSYKYLIEENDDKDKTSN